ncbi:MAG TPA: TetR/AcrR family transcriptional regulator [Vicinamibacterales bacterium]|nr:TetR/AcrR family transcriptional regulator [Vicinamibacterales bacterium]
MNAQESRHGTETRERILRTAFQLFHEQGFNATGVATIAREAGVNPGSLYHFFESKDDLLLGVLEFCLGYLGPAVMEPAEASAADPLDRVFALLQGYRDHMEREHCCMGCPIGNLALEIGDHNAKARALVHENFENWAARVASWFERDTSLPTTVDRRRLARFILTVMEGGLMQARAAGHLGPFDEAVDVLRDYFTRLGTPAAARTRQKTSTSKKRRRR